MCGIAEIGRKITITAKSCLYHVLTAIPCSISVPYHFFSRKLCLRILGGLLRFSRMTINEEFA